MRLWRCIVGLRGWVTFSEKALSLLFHHVRNSLMAAHKSRRASLADQGSLAPQSWIPGFQNCEKTNFYCLSHSAYGVLLWQPVLANTWFQKKKKTFFLVIFFSSPRSSCESCIIFSYHIYWFFPVWSCSSAFGYFLLWYGHYLKSTGHSFPRLWFIVHLHDLMEAGYLEKEFHVSRNTSTSKHHARWCFVFFHSFSAMVSLR